MDWREIEWSCPHKARGDETGDDDGKRAYLCISPTASVCDICCKCVRAIRKIYYIRLPSRVYNIIYILCMYIYYVCI